VLAGEGDQLLVEGEVGDISRRVGRVSDDQHLGPRHGIGHRLVEPVEEVGAGRGRNRTHRRARYDEAEAVDGIGRVGGQHRVAGRGDRLGKVGEALLATESDDDLPVRVELDAEAALVIGRLGFAQAGDALRRGVAMGAGLRGDFA
jgi:hypothetical protein